MRRYEIDDHVFYKPLPNISSAGLFSNGNAYLGVVVSVFGGEDGTSQQATYRIKLYQKWGDKYPEIFNQRIVVGNVGEGEMHENINTKSQMN